MAVKCPKCQNDNTDTQKFCGECATPLSSSKMIIDSPTKTLETPIKDLSTQETIAGKYKLLEKLGEGGMGTVFTAEQTEPVRRRIALKIIKLGMDTKQVVARFEAERQALAVMDHPNIAKVYDGGATETGRPYFVMEFVHGIPITEYCDKHKLSTRERLNLFLPLCQAVQHAHQKGVIHRDLKPSNVLVAVQDAKPVPKIIDFGIAKATDHRLTQRTLFTEQGQLIGTPEYMSPEQAEMSGLDVDTRTDIYSLGVMLYELLVGVLPFSPETLWEAGFSEIQRIIRETDPPKASTRLISLGDTQTSIAEHRKTNPVSLHKQLKGDLDWILMKAMEKDRTRRYETANSLAMDIQRHISNVPILARPPSGAYQFRKLIARHKVPFVFIVALFVLITSSAIIMMVERNRAVAAEERASREAAKANAIKDFLQNMLASADPSEDGREVKVADVLDRAAEKISSDFSEQPEIEASVHHTIGTTFISLGLYDKARSQLEVALKIRRTILGEEHPDTLSSMSDLVAVLYYQGKLPEAEKLSRETVKIQRRVLGDEHRETLTSMVNLGALLNKQDKYAEAETTYRQLLKSSLSALEEKDPITLTTLNNLALSLKLQKKFSQAEEFYRRALDIRMHVLGEDHPQTLVVMTNLAILLNEQERSDDAEKMHRKTLEIKQRVLGREHPETLASMNGLGLALRSQNKYMEAEVIYRQLIEIAATVLPQGHWRLPLYRGRYGYCLTKLGSYSEAEPLLLEAYAGLKDALGEEHRNTKSALKDLIHLYESWGKKKQADEYQAMQKNDLEN